MSQPSRIGRGRGRGWGRYDGHDALAHPHAGMRDFGPPAPGFGRGGQPPGLAHDGFGAPEFGAGPPPGYEPHFQPEGWGRGRSRGRGGPYSRGRGADRGRGRGRARSMSGPPVPESGGEDPSRLNPGATVFRPQPPPRRPQQRTQAAPAPDALAAAASDAADEPDSASASPNGQAAEAAGFPTCVVCCEELKEASVGQCNHKDVCGTCALRMRMCYRSKQCPLCKAELAEVVITPWRPGGVPDWQQLQPRLASLWSSPSWQKGVFVDDSPPPGAAPGGAPLSARLQARTGRVCSHCDRAGVRPFPSQKSLLRHVEQAHHRQLCRVCLEAGRQFPAELPALGRAELAAHLKAAHPRCRFCAAHFFGPDELWAHLRGEHWCCQLCLAAGAHVFFAEPRQLLRHLDVEHFRCNHPECRDAFVAFPTQLELAAHRAEAHADGLAWLRPRRGPPTTRGPPPPAPPPAPQGERSSAGDLDSPREGGLRVIDDDLGLQGQWGEAPPLRAAAAPRRQQAESAYGQVFPSLAGGSERQGGAGPQEAAPRLVGVARRCPCGRRSDRPVVPEGQAPPPLACDAGCERERRRQQLAAAFDVSDPDRRQPVMDRHEATYSPEVLLFARANPDFVRDAERTIQAFCEVGAAPRHVFPPARKEQRRALHELGAAFRMASQSAGEEPQRHVRLFRGSQAAVPRNLLSRQAAGMSEEEVAVARSGGPRHALHLSDVAPGADLLRLFDQWEGHFRVEAQPAAGTAVLLFDSPTGLQQALAASGGGRRRLFLVDQAATHAAQRQAEGAAGEQRRREAARPQAPRPQGGDAWQPVQRRGRGRSAAPGAADVQEPKAAAAPGFEALEAAPEELEAPQAAE